MHLSTVKIKLENVTINDVLLLKAARHDAIANLKCLVPRDISNLISMVSFTFTTRRHLIGLASAPLTSSRLAKFGWVPFAVCSAWQRSRTHNLRRVAEIPAPMLTRFWTKVHEIFRQCRRPFVLSNTLDRLSKSRYIQKIFANKSRSHRKPNKCKSFFAPIFWEGRPRLYYGRSLAQFIIHGLAKFGWVPFADPCQQSLAMK